MPIGTGNLPAQDADDNTDGPEYQVVFTPSGLRGRAKHNETVLDVARRFGVDLDSICGGRGICGRCQILPTQGKFPKHGIESTLESLSEESATEARYRRVRGMGEGFRLGCSTQIRGDVVLDVHPEFRVHRSLVRKKTTVRDVVRDPAVELYYCVIERPVFNEDTPMGIWEACRHALFQQWELGDNIAEITIDIVLAARLLSVLETGDYKVTFAIHSPDAHSTPHVIAAWPGFHADVFGIAIDIGSTSISLNLLNLSKGEIVDSSGAMNPQIRFGEDLMSRVSYAMLNPEGGPAMTETIRAALNTLITDICALHTIDIDYVVNIVIVANPVMHHLLLDFDPSPLGVAPFLLAVSEALDVRCGDIGITALRPARPVYLLPLIAGHVGADAAAVLLAEAPWQSKAISLIIDIGTNAELILGNEDRILACSSPTGPALEGAQITHGQRAANGAIERVRIDTETGLVMIRVIGCDAWSHDDDFDPGVQGVTGICGSGIIEAIAEMYLADIITPAGIIDGTTKNPRLREDGRTFRYVLWESEAREISITQNDVRAIQLAKAALYAGSKLLLSRFGVDSPDQIMLAGAFGSHIDPRYAMILGFIPDCPLDKVKAIGNGAGDGAIIALLSRKARRTIEQRVREVEKIETATEKTFQEYFVAAISFPHESDPFPHLSSSVKHLPRLEKAATPTRTRRRRASAEGHDASASPQGCSA
ncbi:MAG: ASKHA domain-containing protein [Alphaproteobacteria bacterium]|nr:ASKHA domain-containing protein [Alphaproteobacteria bacterium]